MEAKDLRQKTTDELTALADQLRAELHEAGFAVASQQQKKVSELRRLKRDLARTLTVLGQAAKTSPKV